MNADIRTPGEEHREQIAELLSTSLNFARDRAVARSPMYPLDDMRVAVVNGLVVATAGEFPFHQWFGGKPVACSGIWGVATLPEHREGGLATACVDAVLVRAHERGTPISALYPALLRPYRRMGFELAGTFTQHRLPLDGLPPRTPDLPTVELVDQDRDVDGIRDAYRSWISTANGPVEPVDEDHWRQRILRRSDDDSFRAVVVRDDDHVTGLASFSRSVDPGPLDIAFGLECHALFAADIRAVRALLGYFRGFRGLGKWVQWTGPVDDPLSLSVSEAILHTEFRYDWMLRLLDVPAAFEARGYPALDADAVVAVDDPRWPGNAGPWRITVRGGAAEVTPEPGVTPRPIPIGALSSMFSGFLRVPDAVRLGVLDAGDPSLDGLTALLAGPDPWCPFFF